MSHIHHIDINRWVDDGEASYGIIIPAVEKFGEAAVKQKARWIEATIKQRFEGIPPRLERWA